MAKTVLDSGRRVFANLKYLYFTPWTDESTIGGNTYDLVNIVGDTTSSEQDDPEVNEIAHEFSNEPLYENINLGKKNFSTECLDFQNDVVKELFGWTVDSAGHAFAPIQYNDLYCTIEMGFNSSNDVIVLPKVKLNSKAVISSLKTDASRGNISGTAYSAYVKVGSGAAQETDMAIIKNGAAYNVTATGDVATSLTVDSSKSVTVNATVKLTATVAPTGTPIVWKSSDESIALVTETGYVVGVRAGSCTVSALSGGKSAECAVTVSAS